MKKRVKKVNDRVQRFIELYTTPGTDAYLSGTESALGAGYGGGDRLAACRYGSSLRSQPHIDEAIQKRLGEIRRELKDQCVKAIEHTACQATADIGQAYDEQGALLPLRKMPANVRLAIASMEVEELFEGQGEDRVKVGVLRKVKLHDKRASQELLARWAGELNSKVELGGGEGGPSEVTITINRTVTE